MMWWELLNDLITIDIDVARIICDLFIIGVSIDFLVFNFTRWP